MVACATVESDHGWSVSFGADGMPDVEAFGFDNYRKVKYCPGYHVHDGCVEFIYCSRGNCVYDTPDGEFELKAGCVFASGPGQPHGLKKYHCGLRMSWIRIAVPPGGKTLFGLSGKEGAWLAARLLSLPRRVFRGGKTVWRCFRRLADVHATTQLGSPERTLLLRVAALDLVLALLSDSSSRPATPARNAISGLVEEMREHPARVYAISEMSAKAMMSQTGFVSAFKRQTGMSPHAFLLSVRIERAKTLLAEGRPVAVVSDNVGFSSSKRFATCFRQTVGMTPSEFRKSPKF